MENFNNISATKSKRAEAIHGFAKEDLKIVIEEVLF